MKKSFSLILAITLIVGGLTLPTETASAQCIKDGKVVPGVTNAKICENVNGTWQGSGPTTASSGCGILSFACQIMEIVVPFMVGITLKFVALLTGLAGYLLNGVVYHTIVNVSDNYRNLKPIKEAWGVLRDLANMSFIFVLLYAGIRTILGQEKNSQEVIKNVIIAAVLMNFSLFLTGMVIDISNVFALTFYDAIAPGVAAEGFNFQTGLSSAFTQYLSIQTLYQVVDNIDINGIITTGLMGSVLLIVAAFTFFATAILFIIRYVVLILVLILSPVYFVALALPKGTGIDTYKNQWLNALTGQAFFAPIYFLLTWIAVQVMGGVMTALQKSGAMDSTNAGLAGLSIGNIPSSGSVLMFINFSIVITLIITALTVSKQWADKAGGGIGNLTKWATGVAGGATMGMAARLGRSTIGAGASRAAQSESFQRFAGRSVAGQFALNQTRKAAGASYDFRASRAGDITLKDAGAGQAKQGGYEAKLQEKLAKRDKFAQTLSPTTSVAGRPSARESYATRISGGPLTHGGTRNSANTIMGTLGRHNRVAASRILQSQLAPLETQQQTLQTRENQLNQQLSNMTSEQATLTANPARTPQQNARLADLNDITTAVPPGSPAGTPPVPTNRNSIAYIQHQLTNTQADLGRADTEVTRIRGIVNANQLTNPANPIVNPVTGRSRPSRADEQNY